MSQSQHKHCGTPPAEGDIRAGDLSAGYVQITFWVFAVIFTALLIADVSIIAKQIAEKSKQNLDTVKH